MIIFGRYDPPPDPPEPPDEKIAWERILVILLNLILWGYAIWLLKGCIK